MTNEIKLKSQIFTIFSVFSIISGAISGPIFGEELAEKGPLFPAGAFCGFCGFCGTRFFFLLFLLFAGGEGFLEIESAAG